jgi:hypothetical protein
MKVVGSGTRCPRRGGTGVLARDRAEGRPRPGRRASESDGHGQDARATIFPGTTKAVTDHTGAVLERWDHYPFGRLDP